MTQQDAVKTALNDYIDRGDHGSIKEICSEIEMTPQALGKWRSNQTKRLKPENLEKLIKALQSRNYLADPVASEQAKPKPGNIAAAENQLRQKREQAFLSLAAALDSLVVELRGGASLDRKANRLKWEVDNLRDFLDEYFGEKAKNVTQRGDDSSTAHAPKLPPG